ncbi:asparagine synthase-related protein [Halostagnicola kamekurae]|uniref:Asparagine synthase (Glutamine-hydrolysing) n=1 Tax=Halostagnicola kamekurae TaxID=619731 RepID=A0A1I6QHV2_9EURY|nr:asparagine synthase-related protein [Halostagnicola kamekurae]SFS51935.1 asparagine synthase (glutamine-hydrolysing) [Halostagnicola kamekurae]
MPGITVADEPIDRGAVDDALGSVCFTDRYDSHYVIDDEGIVAHSGYDEYPIEVFDTDAYTIVLEGHLYGTDDVETTVTEAAELVAGARTEELSEWVGERDGDFLLVVVDQDDGETWAINDAFGRLPTYRATVGGTTILTRELKVVRELAGQIGDGLEPDSLALGQMLLFGYPLGTRTLFEGVEQLPPGSVLELESDTADSIHEFQFDEHANEHRSVEENARRLRDRFVDACQNRASVTGETVVSLSGGLDSRAVIAGYTHADGELLAATSARTNGGNAAEVDVARQVANALEVPWQSYVADRTDRHRELLLEMSQGMNNLGMSLGLNFAEQVAADHPDATFVTGDGGDKAIPDLTPSKDVDSMDELVELVVDGQQVFSLEEVTDIVDVDPARLVSSVRSRLLSYPESTLEGRYVHFLVRERGINWLNHGEDRTRYYTWSTTPFYALPFFEEAMACPPAQKDGTKLYREFLAQLSPATLEIDYVDFGAPIDSLTYRVKRFGYDWLSEHPGLKDRVFGLLGQGESGADSPPMALAEATSDPSDFREHFSSEAVQRVTWSGGRYTATQQYFLLTLIAAVRGTDGSSEADSESVDGEAEKLSVSQ